jgi:hypothetical protein
VGCDAAARRRRRRIELARPAYVAVTLRDIMVCWFPVLSGAPQAVSAWAATLIVLRFTRRDRGGSGPGDPGGVSGASGVEALYRCCRCGSMTQAL